MKYFNIGYSSLLLLLPFILAIQEAFAENSTSTNSTTNHQGLGAFPGFFLIDKIGEFVSSIGKLLGFRSRMYEIPRNRKLEEESEDVTYSFYDYDNKYKESITKKPSKNKPGKLNGKVKKGE